MPSTGTDFFGIQGNPDADEIAQVLDISSSTVNREWKTAKVWLRTEMDKGDDVAT